MEAVLRFLGLGLCLFAALWTISETTDPVFPVWRRRVELLRERGAEIEAIAIGNSHGRAIDFEALQLEGLHLWRSGSDVFETRHTLQRALPHLPRLKVVFVSVSFVTPSTDNALPVRNNRFATRMEQYAGWRPFPWIEGDLPLAVGAVAAPIVRPDHWKGVVRSLIWGRRTPEVRSDGSFGQEMTRELDSVEALASYGRRRAAAHARIGAEMVALDSTLPSRAAAALEEIVRLAESRGARVVLFTPPYFRTFGSSFDAVEKARLRSMARRLDAEHCSAVYLDYSEHPGFADSAEMFRDGDHLSPVGARAFSLELGRRLLSAGWCPAT